MAALQSTPADVVVGSGVEEDDPSICHATSPLGCVAIVVVVASRFAQHFRFLHFRPFAFQVV